jgi:hypothetical protein
MPEGAAIGVLLGVLVIGVAVETLIGAVFLRAAVALYNKLVGGASSPSSVPEPAFGKAMWIIFAISLAQFIAGLVINLVMDAGPTSAAARRQGADEVAPLISLLISLPVNFLIMAGILSAKLPTTPGRAILVSLCYLFVALLVVGVLVGIAVLVFVIALRGA